MNYRLKVGDLLFVDRSINKVDNVAEEENKQQGSDGWKDWERLKERT